MPVLGNKSISNGSNKEQVRRNIFKSAFMFLIISLQAKGCFFVLFLRNSFILIPIVRVSAKYPVMRKQTSLCFRWHIETAYYEQKKFLSFGKYMLRSRDGTEYLLNLITLAYSILHSISNSSKNRHLRFENEKKVAKQVSLCNEYVQCR